MKLKTIQQFVIKETIINLNVLIFTIALDPLVMSIPNYLITLLNFSCLN